MTAIGAFEGRHHLAGPNRSGLDATRRGAQRALDLMVSVWIFSGGIVFFEPSPAELTFLLVLILAVSAGLGLYRSTFGLFATILGFTPFALIACFQVRYNTVGDALIFTLVTIFLMVTSYFTANYIAEATIKRVRLIMTAYTAIAVLSAAIGTLAYLGLMPAADQFLRYGRAKAAFKDPNVYAPFLILPAMFALQRMLLGTPRMMLTSGTIYVVLFVGVFVSFSRAGWAHFALSSAVVVGLVFLLEADARDKARIMLMALLGALALMIALAGLLSISEVSDLVMARLTSQSYDTGDTGRFGRQGYAFELALTHPWGLGPGEFRNLRIIEEPHNLYVSVIHSYGWGGAFFFYVLVFGTLWKGVNIILRPSPYRLLAIPVIATYAVVVGESIIIDSDHWRHIYLLIGLVWGLATAIARDPRRGAPRSETLI